MSFLGKIGASATPVSFGHTLYVGAGIVGVTNVFPTIAAAVAFINNQAIPPSPDNKYLITVQQGDYSIGNSVTPDFVWVEGKGTDVTRLFIDAPCKFGLQFGVGAVKDIGIYDIEGNLDGAALWLRDSTSVYSTLMEPFAIVGGETLVLSLDGQGDPPITVMLQAGDTTAAAIAARINAAPGKPAQLIAEASFSILRIGCAGPIFPVEVHPGAANTLLGWPATGIIGVDPTPYGKELRNIKNVDVLLTGSANPTVGFWDDEISWESSKLEQLHIVNYNADGYGYKYPGSVKELFECHFRADLGAILVNETVTPSGNSWLSMYGGSLNNDHPAASWQYDINFITAATVFMYSAFYNVNRVLNNSGDPFARAVNRTPPYLYSFEAEEGVISTTVQGYNTVVFSSLLNAAIPGKYMAVVTFESQVDGVVQPRDCLLRLYDTIGAIALMEMVTNESQYRSNATSFLFDMVSTNRLIELQFGTSVVGRQVSIRRARLEIWKVG